MAIGRAVWVGFSLIAALSGRIAAQENQSDTGVARLLTPDRLVRIHGPGIGRISGTVRQLRPDLVLRTDSGDRRVSLGSVDTLWVRGRRIKTGAIVGGILGVASGIFLGSIVDAVCEFDCRDNSEVTIGLLGGGTGMVVGAVVGAAIPKWKRAFPR